MQMKFNIVSFLRAWFVFSLCWFLSCSYQARTEDIVLGSVQRRGDEAQKIFVPVIDNKSSHTGIEGELTTALRNTLAKVRNIQVVNYEDDAEFILLGTLESYTRSVNADTLITGTAGTEQAGGLRENVAISEGSAVTLELNVRLLEKIPGQSLRHQIWLRNFREGAAFRVVDRFSKGQGSGSIPNIQLSREKFNSSLVMKVMADRIAEQVVSEF